LWKRKKPFPKNVLPVPAPTSTVVRDRLSVIIWRKGSRIYVSGKDEEKTKVGGERMFTLHISSQD
jgi:hypothetical protein